MEIICTELALYCSKNECARTDTVSLHISEVCDGTVSLINPYYRGAGQSENWLACQIRVLVLLGGGRMKLDVSLQPCFSNI